MVFKNVLWRFGEKFGCQLVTFIISIIIAKILEPSAYGVIAIVNACTQIFTVFIDVGFGAYIVRNKDSDELDYSTAFTANVLLCLFLYFVIYCISPSIADFYHNQQLISLLRVSSVIILISSVKNIQQAYIYRNSQFKLFFFSSLAGTISAGIVGIFMAIKGYGVWSLVISNIFDTFIDTLVMMFTIKWKPKLKFSIEKFKKISSYSSRIMVSFLIDRAYKKLYQLSIGKMYSSDELAYYEKSKSFTEKIPECSDSIIDTVIFPLMCNKSDNKTELVEISNKYLNLSTYIMFPLLIGMAIISESMIIVLLNEKWIDIIPYIRIMCFSELFIPFINVNNNILKSLGRSDIVLKNEIIKKIISIIILIIVISKGVQSIVVSLLLLNFVYFIIDSSYTKQLVGYGALNQMMDIKNNIICVTLMGILVLITTFAFTNVYLELFFGIIVGAISYVLFSIVLKNESFYYLIETIKGFFKK